MIWLTWRQARAQTLGLTAVALVLAATLAVTGPDLVDRYRTDQSDFLTRLTLEQLPATLYLAGIAVLYAAPALIGVFWGAPMVARELEAGTHKVVWTQSISRTRWLTVKLGIAALATVAMTGLISLAVTWWSDPIQRSVLKGDGAGVFGLAQIYPVVFGARGVVPVGYALFALALGTALGMLLRRAVPAMALTLTVVVALQVVMPVLLRAHLMPTQTLLVEITNENVRGLLGSGPPPSPGSDELPRIETFEVSGDESGAWSLRNETVKDGLVPDALPAWTDGCMAMMGPPAEGSTAERRQATNQACYARLAAEGYRQRMVAHPASHFWPLQLRETGLLLALAAAATGFCFWRIRRDFT